MYNWYRKKVDIGNELGGQQIYLTIKKSQYVTQVYVNGMSAGISMECYTPIEFNITGFVKIGGENEILIQVGDRAWLPSEAAGSTDKEKIHYMPGIWDDVYLTATGNVKVSKALFLPSLAKKEVTVKALLRSAYPPQMIYGERMNDKVKLEYVVREKKSGRIVATAVEETLAKRDNLTYVETVIPINNPVAWSTDNPFLYEGEIRITEQDNPSDNFITAFGMRDFGIKGKHFTLNGEKFYLRGSNITLQRFFEDPDCSDLVWNREWVKKLMIELPKSIDWNAFRICVGIVPDFWYDLCDEYGIVLQNEWFYWQNHGWDEQIRKEYTNWVWSDGNHPSIVIWDAINENWDDYIGYTLIPELKKLDPTRVWDAGYMTSDQMSNDDMDEPHPYRALTLMAPDRVNEYFERNPYNIGDLQNWDRFRHVIDAGVPQLVNEYGWIWLWRNGKPSKLTLNNYNYFLGENASPEACRELQAYWLQMETEWLRAERSLAGVLAFCYLTNNYGFTGDWFINHIKDLDVSPTFQWFKHCFAPQAVFIDLVDRRYTKHTTPCEPDSELLFNLYVINDLSTQFKGYADIKLINGSGEVVSMKTIDCNVPAFERTIVPCSLILPSQAGGYAMIAECYNDDKKAPVVSRRYLKIGQQDTYFFPELKP
jgi:beta-galactosidase/beta-glucuronidase